MHLYEGLQEVMRQWGNEALHSIGLLRGLKLEVTSCQVGNLMVLWGDLVKGVEWILVSLRMQ